MKISIVTPSFNQGRFIRATIESVFSQNYADIEYLVMDGGSTDDTVEILKSYGDKIIWVSEKDGGQADAVNKGIERATGEIIGWINSDDIYYQGAFSAVMKIFEEHPEINVIYGHADHINEDGTYMEDYYTESWDYNRLKEICYICQPAVFFRRLTVIEHGLLNVNRHFAMDYDLWLRMGKKEKFYFLNQKLAGSRLYKDNKTLGQVGKVHIDIMDVLMDNLGYVPERWIEGSAHSVARSEGYNFDTQYSYVAYKSCLMKHIEEYVKRYSVNPKRELNLYPFKYQNLNIGIDISCLIPNDFAGVPYYTYSVVKCFAAVETNNKFLLYTKFNMCYPSENKLVLEKYGKNNVSFFFKDVDENDVSRLHNIFNGGSKELLLETLGYPDVVLCPSFRFSKNLSKIVPTVYTIHDVSFLEHPEYTTKANYEVCFSNMFDAALYAEIFIAVSEYSKSIFLKYFPFVDRDRVRVVTEGYRQCFVAQGLDIVHEFNNLNINCNEKFWLFVGTIEPRKNIVSLIKAYAKLKKLGSTYPLYIAGGKGWLNSEIYELAKKLQLQDDVRFLGYVTDNQLVALYRSCYAFIYPSWYEGFGLPVLEAMAAGAAVITSDTTSLPEVGGDAVMYVQPGDVDSIVSAMFKLQNDSNLRKLLQQRGHERAVREFSWQKCTEEIYKAIYDAIASFTRK